MKWNEVENPLGMICEQWLKKIDLAIQAKHEAFGRYADEAMKFYDGDHAWMWDLDYSQGKGGFLATGVQAILPKFRMTVNRVAELVALYGPSLYHRNPNIQVTPIDPPGMPPEVFGIDSMLDPMMQDPMAVQQFQMMQQQEGVATKVRHAHSDLQSHYLNWLQLEEDKKVQSRRSIAEALIKGLSLLETSMFTPDGGSIKYPVSKFLSVDDLQVDPDARYWEDVTWIAIRCEHPVWQVELEYGLERGSLKAQMQSKGGQAETEVKTKRKKNSGKSGEATHDLLVYWKIYSKCGIGDLLKGIKRDDLEGEFDFLGKFCFLAVAKGIPYPLNIPNEISKAPEIDEEQLAMQQALLLAQDPNAPPMPDPMQEYEQRFAEAADWPIPFWMAKDGWPVSRLFFYDKPREIWPMSIIKPAIGYLRFINWGMSFLADKAAASSTTYVAVLKSAAETLKAQLADATGPFHLLEIPEILGVGANIEQLVQFLDAPDFGEELYNVLAQVNQSFDKCTGLTELMYGLQGTQARSATEMQIKDQNISVRPDDMASQVEDWLSRTATMELIAARMLCDGNDVKGPLGDVGAWVWENQIMTTDVEYVIRSFNIRVEAGSARKPNKTNRIQQLNELGQTMMPTLQGFAQMGQVKPLNAFLGDVAKAMDMDASAYMVQPPPPPAPVESQPPPSK